MFDFFQQQAHWIAPLLGALGFGLILWGFLRGFLNDSEEESKGIWTLLIAAGLLLWVFAAIECMFLV